MGDLRLTDWREGLTEAMALIARRPESIFLGQHVIYGGHALTETMARVSQEKIVEMPIAEEMTVGMAIGLSLEGFLPVVILPRVDFLMRAMDQLVNHLDKMEEMSRGGYKPKVIIRTAIGATSPLDPGPQHSQDHVAALQLMLSTVAVVRIEKAEDVIPAYQAALLRDGPSLLVEADPLRRDAKVPDEKGNRK